MSAYGGLSVRENWNKEKEGNGVNWNKIDAIGIIVMRFYVIMFIVSVVISVISMMFIGRAAAKIESYKYKK